MTRHTLFCIGALALLLPPLCSSQDETAVSFLLISPYAEANGMGEASVALPSNDPLAPVTNPAQLGMQSLSNYFSAGTNYADWLPGLRSPDLWYRASAVNAGVNLNKLTGMTPDVSIGFGYSRVYFNYGDFFITGPAGPEPIGTFHVYESADQYTAGAGIDYGIKASVGITLKHIYSQLGRATNGEPGSAKVNSFDYGILLDVPLIRILRAVQDEPLEFLPGISPVVDIHLGFAKNNLGDKSVTYIDPQQADPLPRYVRAGIGITLGIDHEIAGDVWHPVEFRWTREANDILVRRVGSPQSPWEYTSGFGAIKFFDELVLGKTNPETIMKKGWEFNLFETVSLRGGRYEEDYNNGNRRFSTSGYGFQTGGIVKLLRVAGFAPDPGTILGFLVGHIDLRYNHSTLTTDAAAQPLSDTKFDSFVLRLSN